MKKCEWCDEQFEQNGIRYSHFIGASLTCTKFEVLCSECGEETHRNHFVQSNLYFGDDCEVEYKCGKFIEFALDNDNDGYFRLIRPCGKRKMPECHCEHYQIRHEDDCAWWKWKKDKK